MGTEKVKGNIVEVILGLYTDLNYVLNTTLTGSFSRGQGLDGISDIDTIVIVTELTEEKFIYLCDRAQNLLAPLFSINGYKLRINTTFGPLKYNDIDTAVLHLMIYDAKAHREHAIKSPFTCFDWQQSSLFQGAKLEEIYPVFALQPRHFISSRRSSKDYLKDLLNEKISFREAIYSDGKRKEILKQKPMTIRDKYEFAYHIVLFLLLNLYKLANRKNITPDREELLSFYFSKFPVKNQNLFQLFKMLQNMKSTGDFDCGISGLDLKITEFVTEFLAVFSSEFSVQAKRHIFFRHAPTELNTFTGEDTVFLGATDSSIMHKPDLIPPQLTHALTENETSTFLVSRMKRTTETVRMLDESINTHPTTHIVQELNEINYGSFEGKTLRECRKLYPDHFEDWSLGKDPRFPGGENTGNVLSRLLNFLSSEILRTENVGVCTHNVVLRCLIGEYFNIPRSEWYRLNIPHMMPIILIQTSSFGNYVEMDEDIERIVFEDFFNTKAGL